MKDTICLITGIVSGFIATLLVYDGADFSETIGEERSAEDHETLPPNLPT